MYTLYFMLICIYILYAKLAIICYAIPSHARISLGKKQYWKPSCFETLEGIVAHVDVSKVFNP